MLCNVVDNRKRPYRWRKVNAVIEATSHDNACHDADQQPRSEYDLTYDKLEGVTVQEACAWADRQDCAVTLYLYDQGTGTN